MLRFDSRLNVFIMDILTCGFIWPFKRIQKQVPQAVFKPFSYFLDSIPSFSPDAKRVHLRWVLCEFSDRNQNFLRTSCLIIYLSSFNLYPIYLPSSVHSYTHIVQAKLRNLFIRSEHMKNMKCRPIADS